MILGRLLSRVAVLSILVALPAPAWAQRDEQRPSIPFEGADVFAYLLKVRGYTALQRIADLAKYEPRETLLVLFGKLNSVLPAVDVELGSLHGFQRNGGGVLIASDYACGLPRYGVRIAGRFVQSEENYGKTPDCPLIKALEEGVPASFPALGRGLATNRPSYFESTSVPFGHRPDGLRPLAGFMVGRRLGGGIVEYFGNAQWRKHAIAGTSGSLVLPYAYLTEADAQSAGRALLIAGNGIFTNGMLLQADNDNFPFAIECLDWLGKQRDGGRRKHALFIVDGKVIDSFDVGLNPPPLPLPPIPTPPIALVNQLIHDVEAERLPLRILEDSVDVRLAVRIGLLFLTLMVLCYAAKKFIEQRHHSEKGSALLAGPYAVPPDTSPPVEQRARSQIERNALGVEARALVRAWFLDTCAIPIAAWDRTQAMSAPDAFVQGGWRQRYRVRGQIDRLARLAGGTLPGRFSWIDMVRLTKTLQALRAAVEQGRLRFVGCSPDQNS